MVYSSIPDLVFSPPAQGKPRLSSYDSSEEFSFEHLLEVRRLVALAEQDELKNYVFDDSLLCHE